MKCIDCTFSKGPYGFDSDPHYECRRYPPVLDPRYEGTPEDDTTDSTVYWIWPLVNEHDHCGEFVRKGGEQ